MTTEIQEPTYAAIYARTSVDDKDDPRGSTGHQVQDGKALATKLGFVVRDENVFIDLDLKGSLPPTRWQTHKITRRNHRPGLDTMMQAIADGTIHAIIVRKRDRLFRHLEDSLKFFRFLESHKIQLHATDERINLDGSASSRLELRVMMSIAEYQLETTRENVLQAKRHQKAEGMKMGPCLTLGYRNGMKAGMAEIVPSAVSVVKEIYDRYIAGQSRGRIMEWLNAVHKNLLPSRDKRYAAQAWYHSHIARILANPHYIGMTKGPNGSLIRSKAYAPIIDASIWHQVQKLREVRRNPLHGRRVAEHLLSSMLTCGYCGTHLVIYSRYHSTRKERIGFEYKCPKHHEGLSPFNMREMLWDEWADMVFAVNPIEEEKAEPAEITQLKIELDAILRNLSDLDAGFTAGKMTLARMEALRGPLSANAAKLKARIDNLYASTPTDTTLRTWSSLTHEQKRTIIRAMTAFIRVYRDGVIVEHQGDKLDTMYPLVHKQVKGFPSARPFNALIPSNPHPVGWKHGSRNGRAYRMVVWKGSVFANDADIQPLPRIEDL